jgi:hypothetical protein
LGGGREVFDNPVDVFLETHVEQGVGFVEDKLRFCVS